MQGVSIQNVPPISTTTNKKRSFGLLSTIMLITMATLIQGSISMRKLKSNCRNFQLQFLLLQLSITSVPNIILLKDVTTTLVKRYATRR